MSRCTRRSAGSAALVAVVLAAGCKGAEAPKTPVKSEEKSTPDAAKVVVTKDRKDLVLSYFDPTGKLVDVSTVDEVPEASRAQVLVRDLSKSPDELHAADFLYIADLRVDDGQGRYPCGAVSRRAFDRAGAAQAANEVAGNVQAEGGKVVTLYTAAWCGVCKTTKTWLRRKGIAFVEKDVEKDAGAEDELAAKAAARGLRPQGVPVIDVAGELMMGFDEGALSRLLEKQGITKGT